MVNVITGLLSIACFLVRVMKELYLLEQQEGNYTSRYVQTP